jgi:hypothetical protein
MLFPGFSFELFFVKRKVGFLRRMLNPSDTLAAVMFLVDRESDFPQNRGFSAELLSLLSSLGIPELAYACEKGEVALALAHEHEKESLIAWDRMRKAKSTAFLCTVFSCPRDLFQCLLYASSINLTALRIFLLMWSGAANLHFLGVHERSCRICSLPLSTQHGFGCEFGVCEHLRMIVAVRNGKYDDVVRATIEAFFNLFFRLRPCILSEEEQLLLETEELGQLSSLQS